MLMTDGVATTSPEGGYENVLYNTGNVSTCTFFEARGC